MEPHNRPKFTTVVLIIRTYALFEQSRRVLVLLLVVAFGGIGVTCVSPWLTLSLRLLLGFFFTVGSNPRGGHGDRCIRRAFLSPRLFGANV